MFKESPVEADDELLRPQRGGVVESGEGVLNSCCFGCCSHETRISTGFQFNSIGSTFRQQLYKGWEFLHIPLTSTIICGSEEYCTHSGYPAIRRADPWCDIVGQRNVDSSRVQYVRGLRPRGS